MTENALTVALITAYGPEAAILLGIVLLVAVLPILAVLAWWLKHRYAAAVVRLQRAADAVGAEAGGKGMPAGGDGTPSETLRPLVLRILPARDAPAAGDRTEPITATPAHAASASRRLRRRVLAVQCIGGFLYWIALAFLVLAVMLPGAVDVASLLLFFGVLSPWLLMFMVVPAGIAWVLLTGASRRLMNAAAAVVMVTGLVLQLQPSGWESEVGFSFGYACIALMVSIFLRPSVRGAGGPLLVSGTVAVLVLMTPFAALLAWVPIDEEAASTPIEDLIGVVVVFALLAAAVWAGWRTLLHLADRYAAKRFSDTQLALTVYWAGMTVFLMGSMLGDSLLFAMTARVSSGVACVGVAAVWLLWRQLQSLALRWAVRDAAPSAGALLFLRVFKPSRRSEDFTDRFFAWWRFAAPVWMIGGPDLAGANMEPDEFFAFLRRRLRDRFVTAPGDAATRVAALDTARDPDGRFRISELLCADDTWRPAVVELIAAAAVCVLDLREYSPQRHGARYELTELLRRAPLGKILVLIDRRDDRARLAEEVQLAWREVGARPFAAQAGELLVLQLGHGSLAELHGAHRAALQAASLGIAARDPSSTGAARVPTTASA